MVCALDTFFLFFPMDRGQLMAHIKTYDTSRKTLEQLNEENRAQAAEIERLKNDLTEAEDNIDNLKCEIGNLRVELETVTEDRDELAFEIRNELVGNP